MSRCTTLAPLGLALLSLASACEPAASPRGAPDSSVSPRDRGAPSVEPVTDATPGSPGDDADATAEDAAVDDTSVSKPDAAVPSPVAPEPTPADDGIPKGPNVFPLVAPSLCTTRNSRLLECRYEKSQIEATSIPETGQFKTRVTGRRQGDCTTLFPFIVRVSADGVAPFNYNIFQNRELWLRRDDSAALARVFVEDGSPDAGSQNYPASCRVWLELELNVPIQLPTPAM